jgi:hypothetical protein
LQAVAAAQAELQPQVADLQRVAEALDPAFGSVAQRRQAFETLRKEFGRDGPEYREHFTKVMTSFGPGLFVGGRQAALPWDNLDLERWFRLPKGHERRIHGRRHVGVRVVVEGPTLLPTLDAHREKDGLFTAEELYPYRAGPVPACQQEAVRRRRVMRRARSRKQRPLLLKELEQRYLDQS